MKLKYLIFLVLLFVSGTVAMAQNPYLQGNKQGAAGVPGTNSRSPLNSLERAGTTADPIPGATILTDTFGNQRFALYVFVKDTCITTTPTTTGNTTNLNSFVTKCGTDSTWYIDWTGRTTLLNAGGGGANENWYTTDDTTTDATRVAYILENAEWYGLSPDGYFNVSMGGVGGTTNSSLYLDATQLQYFYQDVAGNESITHNTRGIQIETSASASRAVDMTTDTINWQGAFDATNFRVNFLSDNSYMYADSEKVVGIGQFPGFPSFSFDGTGKGFMYNPSNGTIGMYGGNGITGGISSMEVYGNEGFSIYSLYDINELEELEISGESNSSATSVDISLVPNIGPYTNLILSLKIGDPTGTGNLFGVFQESQDSVNASTYFGESQIASSIYQGNRAFGVRTFPEDIPFDWIQTYLPNDTTANALSFYNRAYYWANEHPTGSVGDTLFHYWAEDGTNAGKHPGFMTLAQIRSLAGTNWYNTSSITTDNTRIADVLEKAIWRSEDVTADGIYPFVFQLAGESPNEPEMMTWKFPTDSLTLSQSDQEIVFTSSNRLNVVSANELTLVGDSLAYQNQNGTVFKIDGQNSLSTGPNTRATLPNQVAHASGNFATNGDAQASEIVLRRSITGTSETELFLDGTSVQAVLAGTNRIWTGTAKCTGVVTAVGNGATIVAGDVFGQWQPFTIKRIGTNTTLMTPVFGTTVEGWSDTNMGGSTFILSADDTTEALKITFTPPTLAGSTTVCRAVCTVNINEVAY